MSTTDPTRLLLPGRRLTSFLGRVADLGRLTQSLAEHRLVTLLGSGGVGKTRLAEEVLHRIAADTEVAWAELAPIDSADQIGDVIARAVGIGKVPAGDVLDHVIARLDDRPIVLGLDNAEHLIDGTASIAARLLAGCPNLTVLVTSREVLAIDGEATVRLDTLSPTDAANLFVQRQRLVATTPADPADPHVQRICRRLDGIPLALELAATRARALTPEQIADALDDRFTLLTGGHRTALPKQQTLEASVAWSVDLLDDDQRTLLATLSVFSGSFTIDAAVHVADGTLPQNRVRVGVLDLVDRSLVHPAPTQLDKPRFRLLETVRDFARQNLAADAELSDQVRMRHVHHHLHRVRQIRDAFDGPDWRAPMRSLDEEVADLTAAIRHARSVAPEIAVQMVCFLSEYWLRRPQVGTMIDLGLELWDEVGAADADLAPAAVGLAQMLGWTGRPETPAFLTRAIGQLANVDEAEPSALQLESIRAWTLGLASAASEAELVKRAELPRNSSAAYRVWLSYGMAHWQEGQMDRAVELFDRGARAIDEDHATLFQSAAFPWNALVLAHAGLLDRADTLLRQSWPSIIDADDPFGHGIVRCTEGLTAGLRGQYADTADVAADALEKFVRSTTAQLGQRLLLSFWGLTEALLGRGYEDRVDWSAVTSDAAARYRPLRSLRTALRALHEGDHERAVAHASDAELALEAVESVPRTPTNATNARVRSAVLLTIARAQQAAGHPDASGSAHNALQRHVEREWVFWPDALDVVAAVDADANRHERAARLFGASDRRRSEMGTVRFPPDKKWVEPVIAELRDALGDDAYDAAYDAGLQLDQDAAMALARTGRDERPVAGWDSLTPAEQETARLAAAGLSNPDIAEQLFISRNTVKTHLSAAYRKLAVSNRTELAKMVPPT